MRTGTPHHRPTGGPPALSVIIPAHNAAPHITQALQSVCDQSRPDIEVIVIDDGSIDDTAALVRAFIDARVPEAPRIHLINLAKSGVSVARNAGIEVARSNLIAFLDADDRWAPDKADRQVETMAERPDVALCFTGYQFVGPDGADTMQGFAPRPGALPLAELMLRNIIHSSTVVMRRETALQLGGFNTALTTCEDYDLWLRVAALSDTAIFAQPERLADYRRHRGQVTKDWQQMHTGWQQVAARLAQDHPDIWVRIARRAWGNQLEYCASLAFNAGDIPTTRRLIWRAWRRGGLGLMRQPNALMMTKVALVTYLPRPLRRIIGAGEHYARQSRRLLQAKPHRQPR